MRFFGQSSRPSSGQYTLAATPYHPLYGRSYTILKVKEVKNSRLYSLRTESGVMCVPESWTDQGVQQKQESDTHIPPFNAFTLRELVRLLRELDDSSKNLQK